MNLCKITILKDSVIKGHIRSNVDFIFKKSSIYTILWI